CRKASRPYVSAGTFRESVRRGRWRHGPQPPIYRAYAPPETVREPFWRRSRTDDKPPDGPENRNEHGAEQSPATACPIGGRSLRSYRPLPGACQYQTAGPARQRGPAFCLPSIGQFGLRNGGAAHAADSSSPSLALSQAVGTFNRRPNRTVRMSPECAAAYVAPRRNPRTFPVSGQSGKTA